METKRQLAVLLYAVLFMVLIIFINNKIGTVTAPVWVINGSIILVLLIGVYGAFKVANLKALD